MKLIKFNQHEKASSLDVVPFEADSDFLKENDLSYDDLVRVNEGFIGDLLGGLFKNLKIRIAKAIPGSVLKEADSVLKDYKEAKAGIYKKVLKERNKMYKASFEADENPNDPAAQKRYEEMKVRTEKAVAAIEAANKSQLDAISRKIEILTRGKSSTVKDYIELQMAQIQEEVAVQQLKDAEDLAGDDILKSLEQEVKDAKAAKEKAAKDLEEATKKAAEEKKNEDSKPENAKKGQVWNRESSKGEEQQVEIIGDGFDKQKNIRVKNKKTGATYLVKMDSLKGLMTNTENKK